MAVATPSGWARDLSAYRAQAAAWQAQARLHVEGLARSIDHQLDQWQLSVAEKEIAFLLLKGLSLRDIAGLRGTAEKTVRAQSAAVYAKSGLAGRTELSAFFLEDLLVPSVDNGAPGPAASLGPAQSRSGAPSGK